VQIYNIFIQAISLPENKRQSYIKDACKGDHSLIQEINQLLDNDDNESTNTSEWSVLIDSQFSNVANDITELSNKIFGSFRLTKLLGQGGMGAAYLASRNDEKFEQQVAVKIISPLLENILGKEALIREASFMARLNHPNIGKVFDAGKDENGYSYIVMEYIEGDGLATYYSDPSNSLKSKISLFVKLCDAIHHAHQMQVVHADLKPSNILFTRSGELKVLDFGIARLFDAGNDEVNHAYKAYVKALTAKYASPEVKCGEYPSTYSDIYSLGKIFNDILSFDKGASNNAELVAICKKATEHNYLARYASVLELKQDLEAYLANKVVSAYPASRWFKVKKFVVKRYPIPSIAATLFVGVVSYLTTNLYIQHQDLKVEKAQSELVLETFIDALKAPDKRESNGKEFSAIDLLDNTNKTLSESDDITPDSLAKIKLALAKSYAGIGDADKAIKIRKEVIDSYEELTDKELAFKGGHALTWFLYRAGKFEQIEPMLKPLIGKIQFRNDGVVPTTYQQARFYAQYLQIMKYQGDHEQWKEMGKNQQQALIGIKDYYSDQLSKFERAVNLGQIGGIIYERIRRPGNFIFEYVSEDTFQEQRAPQIKDALGYLKQALHMYEELDHLEGVSTMRLVIPRLLVELESIEEAENFVTEAIESSEKLHDENNILLIQQYGNASFYLSYANPDMSTYYAQKAYNNALANREEHLVNYLDTIEWISTAYVGSGQFDEFKQEANNFFKYFLDTPSEKITKYYTEQIFIIFQQYVELFGALPLNHAKLLDKMSDALAVQMSDPSAQFDTTRFRYRNMRQEYIQSMKSLAEQGNLSSTFEHIHSTVKIKDSYIDRKTRQLKLEKLHLQWLRSFDTGKPTYSAANTELPSFTWNSMEEKYSPSRLITLLKTSFVLLKANQIGQAENDINALYNTVKSRKLSENSAWLGMTLLLKSKLALTKGNTGDAIDFAKQSVPLINQHFPVESLIYREYKSLSKMLFEGKTVSL